MKPLTLAEVNAFLIDPIAQRNGCGDPYESGESGYAGGVVGALAKRGNSECEGFAEAIGGLTNFSRVYAGAPVAFVLDRANRILAEIGDES